MDRESYRFVLNVLGWSILLLVIAAIVLAFFELKPWTASADISTRWDAARWFISSST